MRLPLPKDLAILIADASNKRGIDAAAGVSPKNSITTVGAMLPAPTPVKTDRQGNQEPDEPSRLRARQVACSAMRPFQCVDHHLLLVGS
jgi:hypothetical protein